MSTIKLLSLPNNCPACEVDLRGPEIPERSRHFYHPDVTHFLRWVGLYNMEIDRVTHYRCPDCQHLVLRG